MYIPQSCCRQVEYRMLSVHAGIELHSSDATDLGGFIYYVNMRHQVLFFDIPHIYGKGNTEPQLKYQSIGNY